MPRFDDKRVIVTGAAAGLGRIIAQSFAREGADIAILDFQPAAATEAAVKAEGRRCRSFRCDVRDEAAVADAVAGATAFLGGIDVLINNAGFNGHYALVKDMPLAHWRETLDINLTGTMLVTRAALPPMIAAGAGASKWALLGLTQTLALENARHGIRINAVCPGPIEGDRIEDVMRRHAEIEGKSLADVRREWEATPMGRFVEPREVADVMLFLASPAASAMTGQAINVTGGFIMT